MLTLQSRPDTLSTVSSDISAEWTCSICGGNASQCLCVSQNPVMVGDDEIPTVKQFTALGLQDWIRWSQLETIAGPADSDNPTDKDDDGGPQRMEARMMAVVGLA